MKKIIFTMSCCLLLLTGIQAQFFCETFDDHPAGPIQVNDDPIIVGNMLGNWGTLCGNIQYADDAESQASGNVYLKAFDEGCSQAGSWIFNDADFNGDWTQFGLNDECFCYKFNMIDFGNNSGIPNSLMIYSGGNHINSPLRARFILNNPVAEDDGWVKICAPTELSDAGNLPGNAIGQWQMVGGGTAAQWDALIQNVTGVAFYLDIGNSPSEIYGFDDICVEPCPPCGSIVNEHIVCVDGGYQYTFEVENTSGLVVDGIDIAIPGLGYDPTAVIPNGGTYGPVTVFIPEDEAPLYCFNVLMYSGIVQCCDIKHCIDLPLCDPCEDAFLFQQNVGNDGDDCCYEIGVSNNVPNFFTGINTTILTPGVNFTNTNTSANWTVAPIGGAGNALNWSPPGAFIAQLSYLNPIQFCFTDILQTHQMPQTVVFDWLALDSNGQDSIVCSDTLTFNCEPCLMIENKEITCLDDGTYEYCFSVTNNGDDPASQLYLDPYGPSGTVFNPNPVPVSLAPGQTADYCVNISGVSSGDVVEYKALLKSFLGDTLNWCCIVDTFRVTIPDCPDPCVCDEKFYSSLMGFLPQYSINSCKAGLSPFGLDDCYEVTWTRNGAVIGQTTGNEVLYTKLWTKYATYCMIVTIPGTNCKRTICRKLRCQLFDGGGGDLSFKLAPGDGSGTATVKNIYPNPVEDLLTINLNQALSETRVNIQVINAVGETILSFENQMVNGEALQIRVNELSEGVYFLKVDGETIQSNFMKFVKIK